MAERRTESSAPVEPQDARKPWVTPTVIVSTAMRTNKILNFNEYTSIASGKSYGPS